MFSAFLGPPLEAYGQASKWLAAFECQQVERGPAEWHCSPMVPLDIKFSHFKCFFEFHRVKWNIYKRFVDSYSRGKRDIMMWFEACMLSNAGKFRDIAGECRKARHGISVIWSYLRTQLPFAYVHLVARLANCNFFFAVWSLPTQAPCKSCARPHT